MDDILSVFGVMVGIVVVAALIVFGIKAAVARDHWLEAHCQVIGEVSGSFGVGMAVSGKGGVSTVYIPGKTGYQCDDGKQYWE